MSERRLIIDYGLCNLDSVKRATEEVGFPGEIVDGAASLTGLTAADRIILPGVGAFADAMRELHERGLHDAIRRAVLDDGVPILGICLGMQLLAGHGVEGSTASAPDGVAGLDLIGGAVLRLTPGGGDTRIPHVGWNNVERRRPSPLFEGITAERDFYFTHSFHFAARDDDDVLGVTPYCGGFTSVVERGHVHGVQFHPEKSQVAGLRLLKNFLEHG